MYIRKVLIDCDPGIDDALAVLLGLSSDEVKVGAITTVFGNAGVETVTENLIKILEMAHIKRWPQIGKGSDKPLEGPRTITGSHGPDGLGIANLPPPRRKIKTKDAVELIVAKIHSGDADTLITLGPLTNIARAIRDDAGVIHKIKSIFVMAGSLRSEGTVAGFAEFNAHCDPEALDCVLGSGIPITLVSLDATRKVIFRKSDLMGLVQNEDGTEDRSALSLFLEKALKYYIRFHSEKRNIQGAYMHDPLCVAVAIDETLGSYENLPLGVDLLKKRGRLYIKRGYKSNVRFCYDVDSARFFKLFLGRIRGFILTSRGN